MAGPLPETSSRAGECKEPMAKGYAPGDSPLAATEGNLVSASVVPGLSVDDGGPRYSFDSSPVADPRSMVTGKDYNGAPFRFSILTERLFRYEWCPDGVFEDRASTLALFRLFELPNFNVRSSHDRIRISTEYFEVDYDMREFSPDGFTVHVGGEVWHYDGQSYGDLGGTSRTLDGVDGRMPLQPGVLSRKAYAVLDDSHSMLFDPDGWIAPRRPGGLDGYVFAYAGDHKAAIKDFYRLSGKQPLLPRWVLGNWWSRYWPYSAAEYLHLMDDFKRDGIPLCVGVLDMEWHKVDVPPEDGGGWTGYSWNRTLFPEPEEFLSEMHLRGLKVALNDHPADGIRAFEDLYANVARAMGKDPATREAIPFDPTDRSYMDAYFDVLKRSLEGQGVDFWWMDWQQGDRSRIPGLDPLWLLNHFQYLDSKCNLAATGKPITFSRYAGPGSHRYPIGFSGDTSITWESLNFQPEFTATASNIGFGWWSHDIGGHQMGYRSDELMARWIQFACFSPILRLHHARSRWYKREPWNWERETHETIKGYMNLRHRLIPFLFTMNVRAHDEDEPLMQPMYWNHKDEEAAYTVPNQYYFGPHLIVAPITSPHSPVTRTGCTRAWLPPGRYVDLFQPALVYDGGRELNLHRNLEDIPVLAKAGTILPLDGSPTLSNGAAPPSDFIIVLVPGADGYFDLVEELPSAHPGTRPDRHSFYRMPIRWRQKEGVLELGPEVNSTGQSRNWQVKLLGHTNSNLAAQLEGRPGVGGVVRKESSTLLMLDVQPAGLRLHLGEDLQPDVVDIRDRLQDMLARCEMPYVWKEVVWDLVTVADEGTIEERVRELQEMTVDASLKDAVMEIWSADQRAVGAAKWPPASRERD